MKKLALSLKYSLWEQYQDKSSIAEWKLSALLKSYCYTRLHEYCKCDTFLGSPSL